MKRFEEPVLVTRPYLPDLESFKSGVDSVWENRWLTNNGPMLKKFQAELAKYFQVPETNLTLFNNGTLALELGYYAMGLTGGDVITTPFTFVATSHALKRVGATPIFADIDPETLCLDPEKVEKLITPRTKAIVPVHVYGNICDIDGFNRLSEKYDIPVIYDAAHAFGVTMASSNQAGRQSDNRTIGVAGDMSMFSFHPTKLFHSCEGGCLVFKDCSIQDKLFELRNFAIHSELSCTDVGSNAKMNELQALMGLCCLKDVDKLVSWRHQVAAEYARAFAGTKVRWVGRSENDAYCPVVFETVEQRERVYVELKEKCNVFSRRYFYPLLTDFAPYVYAKNSCPIATDIASRVLTLPTYYGLELDDVKSIAQNVLEIVG